MRTVALIVFLLCVGDLYRPIEDVKLSFVDSLIVFVSPGAGNSDLGAFEGEVIATRTDDLPGRSLPAFYNDEVVGISLEGFDPILHLSTALIQLDLLEKFFDLGGQFTESKFLFGHHHSCLS